MNLHMWMWFQRKFELFVSKKWVLNTTVAYRIISPPRVLTNPSHRSHDTLLKVLKAKSRGVESRERKIVRSTRFASMVYSVSPNRVVFFLFKISWLSVNLFLKNCWTVHVRDRSRYIFYVRTQILARPRSNSHATATVNHTKRSINSLLNFCNSKRLLWFRMTQWDRCCCLCC